MRIHRSVLLVLLAVFVVEVAVIVPIVVTQWKKDSAAARLQLAGVSGRVAANMNSTLQTYLHGVTSGSSALSLHDGWLSSDQLAYALRFDTSPLRALDQVFVWLPRVDQALRASYEGFYGFRITEWNGTNRAPVTSAIRSVYWPFSVFYPSNRTAQHFYGLDATTSPITNRLIRNESTYVDMPGALGIVSEASKNNFAIIVVHRDRVNSGILCGLVSARELLEYTLQVMQLPRSDVVLAAYAPLRSPQLLYLEDSNLLDNATTLQAFYALPRSGEFFVQNITILGDIITVCMRFSDSFSSLYAVNTWVILTAVLVPVAFVILGIITVILSQWQHRKDITQLETDKRRESQLMLGYVSHEIRNPLQTILGMSDLCLEEISERDDLDDATSYVQTIVRSAEFIEHIANDILDMRRIEEGQIALDMKEVSVKAVIASLERSVRSFASPQIEFKLSVADEPSVIVTDRHRLEQILLNFLTNAFKYTKKGTVTLLFSRSGEYAVKFAVIDTGRGIPQDMIGSIFEQFKQVKAGDSSSGFGLGLFLSKRIAILLGGSVGVESSETGSTFWLELPVSDLGAEFDASSVPLKGFQIRL